MSGSMTALTEAAMPLGPVGLLLAGVVFLWVVGLAIHSRPRSPRPVPALRVVTRRH